MTPEELAGYLERHELTGPQLAERLGTTRMTVNRWIRGEFPINRITAYALAHLETIMTTDKIIKETAIECATEAWEVASTDDRETIATWESFPLPGDIQYLAEQLGREATPSEIDQFGEEMREHLDSL